MQIGKQEYPFSNVPDSFNIPAHDTEVIDTSVADTVTITYKKANVTVATKTIVTIGDTTTITVSGM